MPRPQFTLKTLLWLTLVGAAFFGGMAWEHRLRLQERERLERQIEYVEQTFVNYNDP